MPFRYSLQKIYEMRERKLKEQEQVVNEATAAVREVQGRLDTKNTEREDLRRQRLQLDPMMLEGIDRYLQHLAAQILQIREELEMAKQRLAEEEEKLRICQQEIDALDKHKEKCYEEWLEEEKIREMKQLDEIASQRYFRQMQEAAQESAEMDE